NVNTVEDKPRLAWVSASLTDSGSAYSWDVLSPNYLNSLLHASAYSPVPSGSFTNISGIQGAISQAKFVIDSTNVTGGIDINSWLRIFGYTTDASAMTPFFSKSNLWRTDDYINIKGFSDYIENHWARPDLLIQDLITIKYSTYNTSYSPMWLRRFSDSQQNQDYVDTSTKNCPTSWLDQIGGCIELKWDGDSFVPISSAVQTRSNRVGIIIGSVIGAVCAPVETGPGKGKRKSQAPSLETLKRGKYGVLNIKDDSVRTGDHGVPNGPSVEDVLEGDDAIESVPGTRDLNGEVDDEGGRFYGDGLTSKEKSVLDWVDEAENIETVDATTIKKLILRLEKCVSKNTELRIKHPDDPTKFV
ncbi:hypothetical protein EV182_005038, partial [Spiromyces aspiralis]